jgi:hypothetical protein
LTPKAKNQSGNCSEIDSIDLKFTSATDLNALVHRVFDFFSYMVRLTGYPAHAKSNILCLILDFCLASIPIFNLKQSLLLILTFFPLHII